MAVKQRCVLCQQDEGIAALAERMVQSGEDVKEAGSGRGAQTGEQRASPSVTYLQAREHVSCRGKDIQLGQSGGKRRAVQAGRPHTQAFR